MGGARKIATMHKKGDNMVVKVLRQQAAAQIGAFESFDSEDMEEAKHKSWQRVMVSSEIFGVLSGLSSSWVTYNMLQEGDKFTRCADEDKEACAAYHGAKSITFSAGQTNARIRIGF